MLDSEWHPHAITINSPNCGTVLNDYDAITDRIIGGSVPPMGMFPWMARLGYGESDVEFK